MRPQLLTALQAIRPQPAQPETYHEYDDSAVVKYVRTGSYDRSGNTLKFKILCHTIPQSSTWKPGLHIPVKDALKLPGQALKHVSKPNRIVGDDSKRILCVVTRQNVASNILMAGLDDRKQPETEGSLD